MPNHSSRPLFLYALPVLFSVFTCTGGACTSDPPGDGDGDDTTGDGDGDTSGDGDGDMGDGDGDGDQGDGDGDDGGLEELRSEAPHDQNPQLLPDEIETLAAANHALTLELYHALRQGQGADIGFSISAYSIESAFGMLYAGSIDPAHGEIAEALHFDLQGDQQHVAHNWLDAQLAARNIPASPEGEDDSVALQTANNVWMLDDFADGVSPDFLELLSIHYDTGLQLANFDVQPDVEREEINGWVAERTNGLITDLFGEGSIDEFTTMVLVNALYMRGPWLEPFSEGYTQQQNFTRLDGTEISVEMMRAPMLGVGHVFDEDYEAVSLPLRGSDLALVVIEPADFAAFEAALDPAALTTVLGSLSGGVIDLRIPKFELEAAFELSNELQGLGMVAPFTDPTSFDAIHPETDTIAVVVHNTVIKIDEDGLEAAAATGIGGDGDGDGEPEPPPIMEIDRPFLLAIHDRPTNTLLFFGRVLEP
jgi:serpin B